MRPTIKELRDSANGDLPFCGRPGGYPIVYVDIDNRLFCPTCANSLTDGEIIDWFIHYEGPSVFCEDCNIEIASAYGDPDDNK